MPYCTQADLVAAYGEEELLKIQPESSPPVDPPVLSTAAIEAAIQAATDEIDSYVMRRYRLPLDAAKAALLKRRCVDIAVYRLAHDPSGEDNTKRTRYNDAMKWLEKLATGKVVLAPQPQAKIQSEERRQFYPRDDGGFFDPYNRPGRIGRFA